MYNKLLYIGIALIISAITIHSVQTVQATGGAGQIAELVLIHLNDAALYLQEGDIASAEEELDKAIKELKDTYEADKEEH